MRKQILLAGAALAFIATPAVAQQTGGSANIDYNNQISTILNNESNYLANSFVLVDVFAFGDFDVDGAALAISDSKQLIDDVDLEFDELDVDEATVDNTAFGAAITADGNVGLNMAAGHYNAQSNIGTISVATGDEDDDVLTDDDLGSYAKANTTVLQSLTNTEHEPEDTSNDDADTVEDTNFANMDAVDGAGNIGANVAAGAFNIQSNVMTLAVATDASLADASAGVIQHIASNNATVSDSVNTADASTIAGAGNIGVNVAAGVGNMQHNSLTVAASGAFGGSGGAGGGGGGGL